MDWIDERQTTCAQKPGSGLAKLRADAKLYNMTVDDYLARISAVAIYHDNEWPDSKEALASYLSGLFKKIREDENTP